MRPAVVSLLKLGRLPDEGSAAVAQLQEYESALAAVTPPVSDQEALALLSVFPSSDHSCFGLAWSVLHLVETAPGWPIPEASLHRANPWVNNVLDRAGSP